jgi:putative Ca2+/H+ antiporter (TMEM165/GDT1 family)
VFPSSIPDAQTAVGGMILANTLDLYVIRIFSEKFEIRGLSAASATIFLVIKRRSMTVVLLRIEVEEYK